MKIEIYSATFAEMPPRTYNIIHTEGNRYSSKLSSDLILRNGIYVAQVFFFSLYYANDRVINLSFCHP